MATCGQCEFKGNSDDYLNHECKTGHTPTQIEHQDKLTGGRFSRQAQKAIERGEAKK